MKNGKQKEIFSIRKLNDSPDVGFEITLQGSLITNEIASLYRSNPLSLPINDFIGSEIYHLQFKLESNYEIPLKVYLQQSTYPYKILSEIEEFGAGRVS